jgi:hypothetical protein
MLNKLRPDLQTLAQPIKEEEAEVEQVPPVAPDPKDLHNKGLSNQDPYGL